MEETTPLTIVRATIWQALVRRLDAAVERDGRLAAARDAVVRPVALLELMAADAYGALGNDVLRADRLRTLLFMSWAYAGIAREAHQVVSSGGDPDPDDPNADPNANLPPDNINNIAGHSAALFTSTLLARLPPQPYEPGVLDHAGLLVLMLAAARVADEPFAPLFVTTVHGIAVSCAAAEVLGRLDPRIPEAEGIEIVLEVLYLIDAARADAAASATRQLALQPFMLDPVERGRWRLLDDLLADSALARVAVALGSGWDGATSHEILGVTPRVIAPRNRVDIEVTPATKGDVHVVFAGAGGEIVAVPGLTSLPGPVTVEVPEGAKTGWVGFSRDDMILESNKARDEMRRLLEEMLALPGVDGVGRIAPARALPHHGAVAVPRRRGLNRVEAFAPAVVTATIQPERAQPGTPVTISWTTSGADSVSIDHGGRTVLVGGQPAGSIEIELGEGGGDTELSITPHRTAGGAGGARVDGPARSIAVQVRSPVSVVLVRPLVLEDGMRIELEEATALLTRAAGALAAELTVVDLPWADDELATLLKRPVADSDPSLVRLLEALAYRALVTPQFEGAIWLALVPEGAQRRLGQPLARWAPGNAARALAVANPAGLRRLFAEVFKAGGRPIGAFGTYLAIHGRLDVAGATVLEVQLDERSAGPGAPSDARVQVVTRDAGGRELTRGAVRVLSASRPAKLDLLVPIADEVVAVELRRAGQTLALIRRTPGELTLGVKADPDAKPNELAWEWSHSENARPRVSLLVARGELETPVHSIDPCLLKAVLPLWRFGGDRLALYATDGWNHAVQAIERPGENDGGYPFTAVIRRLSDGRYFADVPGDAKVVWFLNGTQRNEEERTLRLGPEEAGQLAVVASRGSGASVRDVREVSAVRPGWP